MFINTYIWEKLLTVRLFWAGAGQRVAAQAEAGDKIGASAGACVVHVDATQDHRAGCSIVCAVQNRVTRWFSPSIINPEKGRGTNTTSCWLGIGAGLL